MNKLSPRLQTPISTANAKAAPGFAVREAMEREKIDVLLDAEQQRLHGRLRQILHRSAGDQWLSSDGGLSARRSHDIGQHGPVRWWGARRLPTATAPRRGVKQWLTAPSFASCAYTASYDAELAAQALAPSACGTIGLVGTYQMSFALVDYLQKGRFSNSRFIDASDLVDRIKVIKSAEERELVRRAARMQDGAMRGRVCRGRARYARPRHRRNRAVLQPTPRQRERHLSVRINAG